MPLVALTPPGRLLARRPWTAGHLARGLPMALAVWLAAIPLLGAGPTWAKACYARVARATQRGKAFEYTQLEGAHEQLLIGTVPRSAARLQALHDEGVRAVVTLNQAWEPQAPSATFREAGLEQLRVPTPDYAAPSQRDIRRAVAFIDQHVQAGHHASHGRERCICACACACACAYCISSIRQLTDLHRPARAGGRPCVRALQRRQRALGGVHAGLPRLAG